MYEKAKPFLRRVPFAYKAKAVVWNTFNTFSRMAGSSRRLYSRREEFLEILPKRSVGIELGVFKGEFSEQIIQVVRPRELHLVDVWWTQYGEYYPNWGPYTDYGRLRTRDAYNSMMRTIQQYNSVRTKIIVHVGNDLEYLRALPNGYLDWAYLDTTHKYELTKLELEILKDKVRSGGLITGDDWYEEPSHIHHGLSRAVNEFCATSEWEVVLRTNTVQWAIQQRR